MLQEIVLLNFFKQYLLFVCIDVFCEYFEAMCFLSAQDSIYQKTFCVCLIKIFIYVKFSMGTTNIFQRVIYLKLWKAALRADTSTNNISVFSSHTLLIVKIFLNTVIFCIQSFRLKRLKISLSNFCFHMTFSFMTKYFFIVFSIALAKR